ncbi:MAG: PAS domain S-box protein [Bacteroidetes bacterium]|nr:PAS domain S-box protein [Bacteroidota bacterium]
MRTGALRIAVIYTVAALIWIMLSDRLLFLFQGALNPRLFLAINSGKGFVFVIATGYLLYKLIKADETKLIESSKRSLKADDEIKRLGHIITRVNNIIIITDQDNFICWVNKAFEDFTGYKIEDVAGYSPATFFAGEETDRDILADVLNKKKANEAFYTELNCHKKSGEKFWVYGEYTPLFDDKNKFTGYIAVYNDITWLKQKESDIVRQNEKLKEVAWLSSHEVRRPLANIIGLINMMKLAPYMDEKIKIIENINRSAAELDKIVHSINSTIETEFEKEEPVK